MKLEEIYTSGIYLEKNPSWHVEESPWKTKQVIRMLTRSNIKPKTICEIGCGAGEILKLLHDCMDDECLFWGYEISPQAFELCKSRVNERLHFKLADFRQEKDVFFDLILVMDVIEHLEDYFSFLRDIQPKSEFKIVHIPLDLSVQTVLRGNPLLGMREYYGHIHYFTKETALQILRDTGYQVLDYFYTPLSVELPTNRVGRRILNLPRKLFFGIHHDLAARLLGGFSLLVLAR
ncbi:MAG: class I SAM-dependent methyltransferase [Ktedonobacteraceae bacterium]